MFRWIHLVVLSSLLLSPNFIRSQDQNFNFTAAPKVTEIKVILTQPLQQTTRFEIHEKNVISIVEFDTILGVGTNNFSFKLAIEAPILLPIELDTLLDHVFVVPGETTEIVYDDIKIPDHHNLNPVHDKIEQYYQEKYSELGIRKVIQEAYQFTRTHPDLIELSAVLDSMRHRQELVLDKYSHSLPLWFMEYESSNIFYTTMTYKFTAADWLIHYELVDHDDPYLQELVDNIKEFSHERVVAPFYLSCIFSYASLNYCDLGCFREPANEASILRHLAYLDFLASVNDKELKGCVSYRLLNLINRSSNEMPDSIMIQLEDHINSSIYRNRWQKNVYRDITGITAPNFYLKAIDSTFHSLHQYRDTSILLNYWFVGCRPCQQEIPHEKRLAQIFEDDRIKFINICLKSSELQWRKKVYKEKLPGLNLYANRNWSDKLSMEYNIKSYPRYVLINRNGEIALGNGPRPSNRKLQEIISSHLNEYEK